MNIIDAHIHFSNIRSFHETAKEQSFVDYSKKGIINEFEEAGVVLGIGMGLTETYGMGFPDPKTSTPMGLDLDSSLPNNIVYCAGINPYTLNNETLVLLENELQKDNVVGIKIYLGYYPFYAYDEIYHPVYALAEKYDVPVVFHTGDTYSERGLLKYSHPLTLDEVAVRFRKVRFVMAHFGDPWVLTGAEVVYKNSNMFADLSGLIVGTEIELMSYSEGRFLDHLRHALVYCDHYDRLLFGTDWPLAPIKPYIKFIQQLIPKKYHEDVFYNNAVKVFPKIKDKL
ncbi:amidohydrolase [Heyndrickxia sporothermodurans]|uniref:Amidohydrolase family protein n=1 Tax=Heyndrickxia sporothermodurans TaxID=46224 RepID=A0AB37HIK6_9BACI|nr:amidohydrolase family protein [Heyndrickxia sporothermodurans]MBL5767060.1 amidohydrolase family protein [Heyndrickxia sporothermodurans]MBL5770495.1 amidohydrolase family protein [Heyndrickxia sporothermodurans]MBL5774184.1 amidohydrolase family protein [Heyndrickxia sporothermodurans]MBL5779507.1 amidohydrolase family protein [Heyndrickxia sporothermodurans]MBL5782959.1 amidohydrolase family protein [Heyndrickxia sporothermodurans]